MDSTIVPTEVFYSVEVVTFSNDVQDNSNNEEQIIDVVGVDLIHDETFVIIDSSSKKFLLISSPLQESHKADIKGN